MRAKSLRWALSAAMVAAVVGAAGCDAAGSAQGADDPYVVVLGIAQDGGFPQLGTPPGPVWEPANRRLVSSLGLVDPVSGERWLFDATPDVAEQIARLDAVAPRLGDDGPIIDGIFLTHAHMGHYAGLLQFGREALGAHQVAVYAMPRMREFLASNGPWSQLVELENISVRALEAGTSVQLNDRLSVTPLVVPHRDEYSETVGFVIERASVGGGTAVGEAAPVRALYLPDIDKWERWDSAGTRLEDVLEQVNVAWIDGTFMQDGEIPGRAMDEIPHPFMVETMERIEARAPDLKDRIRFIHLNRTNPALLEGAARAETEARGFGIAREGDVWVFQGS